MNLNLGAAGQKLFARWVEEKISMDAAIEQARKTLPPDEYVTFLLQMGGYAFPTLLLKDLEGNTTVMPVNVAIEEGLIIMPGKLRHNPT